MTRTLWLDTTAGAAGDMICGALLDCGARWEALEKGLALLGLPGVAVQREEVQRGALRACWFQVSPEENPPHRTWRDIRTLLEESTLPGTVKENAQAVFARLAQAEGRVHGIDPETVHFHEVGALDAVVDVVGACLLLADLDVTDLVASPLPMGAGTVETAHGTLPVPVPAVLELMNGWPTVQDDREGEWVTPTGAALVTTLARPGAMPAMCPTATGLGAGTRNPPERPNVVRAVLGEAAKSLQQETICVLEACVDDMTGEQVPPLLDALLSAGAKDAWAQAVWMKKGRPGLAVTALAAPDQEDRVADALLRHSSSFGLRRTLTRRDILERGWVDVETDYGRIKVKEGRRLDEVLHAAPEFEDCLKAAKEAGVPVAEVHAAAITAYRSSR